MSLGALCALRVARGGGRSDTLAHVKQRMIGTLYAARGRARARASSLLGHKLGDLDKKAASRLAQFLGQLSCIIRR